MLDETTAKTSAPDDDVQARFLRSIAGMGIMIEFLVATARGVNLCSVPVSAATSVVTGAFADSSTKLQELAPEVRAKLDSMLDAARDALIEDGMFNPISERLPELAAGDFSAAIPALLTAIESSRTPSAVAAEVLKELGGLRNLVSPNLQRWVLERALQSSRTFTRDGASLGLARLGDPKAIGALRRAIETEPDALTRANLQLVVDELAEIPENGATPKSHNS